MTVKELMAAFKATRGSLSTRPLHRLNAAVNEEHNRNAATVGQPPAPLAHRTVTDTESHAAIERLTKPTRTRKPTPCSCQCRRAEARRAADGRLLNSCNPSRPCGHKGCGLAAE